VGEKKTKKCFTGNSEITRQTQIFGCLGRQPGPNLSEGLKVKGKGDRGVEGKGGGVRVTQVPS